MTQKTTNTKKRLELRIMGAEQKYVDYVHKLAEEGRRSVPRQLELIIEEHMEWSKKKKSKK